MSGKWLALRLFQTRLVLIFERLWPALWPFTALAGVFAVLALGNAFVFLSPPVHGGVLALFVVLAILALGRAGQSFSFPSNRQVRQRLEAASGLKHHPLETLADRPVGKDVASLRLWSFHQRKAAASLRSLRSSFPAVCLARRDPKGLRFVLAFALVLALSAGREDASSRLAAAFHPDFDGAGGAVAVRFDAWITPPEYTGLPPVFLKPPTERPVAGAEKPDASVPAGSILTARLRGGGVAPLLEMAGLKLPFVDVSQEEGKDGPGRAYEIKAILSLKDSHFEDSDHGAGPFFPVTLSHGGENLVTWTLDVFADEPPEISFASPPGRSEQLSLRLDYRAEDDFGLKKTWVEIFRLDDLGLPFEEGPALAQGLMEMETIAGEEDHIALALRLRQPGARTAQASVYHNLTSHPWAGLPVLIRPVAEDTGDQVVFGPIAYTILPERMFLNPVAQAIINVRRHLAGNPEARIAAMERLGQIAFVPAAYKNDVTVFLGLTSARNRLKLDFSENSIPTTQTLLWDLALRIEDDGVALAEKEMRDASTALADALAGDGDVEELERLSGRLEAAMEAYFKALALSSKSRPIPPGAGDKAQGEELENMLAGQRQGLVRRRDLMDLLEQTWEMARMGSRDAARDLLSQLTDILENLGLPEDGASAALREQISQERAAALEELKKVREAQESLLEKSFDFSRQEASQEASQEAGTFPGHSKEQQDGLRRRLGELMLRLGESLEAIPDALGRSERAMSEAVQTLGGVSPGRALAPQSRAVEGLRQAAKEVSRAFERKMQAQGDGRGMPLPRLGMPRDPLGRPTGNPGEGPGGMAGGKVTIPAEAEIKKVREILKELRRRSGEPHRGDDEKDYIERLLPRF